MKRYQISTRSSLSPTCNPIWDLSCEGRRVASKEQVEEEVPLHLPGVAPSVWPPLLSSSPPLAAPLEHSSSSLQEVRMVEVPWVLGPLFLVSAVQRSYHHVLRLS